MLRVLFLRPPAGFWDCLRDERPLMAMLAAWLVSLFCLSLLVAPTGSGVYVEYLHVHSCSGEPHCVVGAGDEALEAIRLSELAMVRALYAS